MKLREAPQKPSKIFIDGNSEIEAADESTSKKATNLEVGSKYRLINASNFYSFKITSIGNSKIYGINLITKKPTTYSKKTIEDFLNSGRLILVEMKNKNKKINIIKEKLEKLSGKKVIYEKFDVQQSNLEKIVADCVNKIMNEIKIEERYSENGFSEEYIRNTFKDLELTFNALYNEEINNHFDVEEDEPDYSEMMNDKNRDKNLY